MLSDQDNNQKAIIVNQSLAEDAADVRHDIGEATADTRCDHITHRIGREGWQIIAVVVALAVLYVCYEVGIRKQTEQANRQLQRQITKLEKSVKKGGQVVVWFDKQRKYTNKRFEQVDMKYPAQYERWAADGSVIERWHWRVEGKPETYRFGDRIQRCVAIYKKGIFAGYRAYSMEDYPTDDWKPAAVNKVKADSLVLRVIGSRKEISHVGGIGWSLVFEEGKFKCLRKNDLNGVNKTYEPDLDQAVGMFNMVDYDRDELHQIASENEDLQKLQFAALLQEDKENFARLIDELPEKQRKDWDNFVKWVDENPSKEFVPTEEDKTLDSSTVSNE
tara:strand:+ start:1103 stop:2101 length:999 start_codon:yes stop_codon:yes gene_type:complete